MLVAVWLQPLLDAFWTRVCLCAVEIHCLATADLHPEAVPAAARPERGLHRGNRLLQSDPDGHQLPAGIHIEPRSPPLTCASERLLARFRRSSRVFTSSALFDGCLSCQLVTVAPSDRHAALQHQPGLPPHRVLRAVRPRLQLHEDGYPGEERRRLPVQGRDAEEHGQRQQAVYGLHRGPHPARSVLGSRFMSTFTLTWWVSIKYELNH